MSPAQELATANAREALARTAKSIKAVQQMQAAARNIALHGANNVRLNNGTLPKVPNGLKIGGLQVAPGVPKDLAQPAEGENPGLWIGALLPKETVSGDQTKVTIKQTDPQAVLNWQTFNVGKETTVVFNQKAGTAKDGSNNWIAFNKINDPSGVPSQILGSIKADGAVYLINRNGIVFGGSSQVNLHSFVASSLDINDDLIGRLLNNPTGEFLFSASRVTDPSFSLDGATSYVLGDSLVPGSTLNVTVDSGAGTTRLDEKQDFALTFDDSGKPKLEFTDAGLAKIGGGEITVSYFNKQGGDITVEAGARLTAPATAANVGGRISLIGPNVSNAGTISTPDGQTVLAAGLEVGFAAHSTDDPTLRGLDTFVGAEGSKTGTATNSGLIDAPRASVVMAGKNVEQRGAIASTTSVSLNGRVDLLAEYDSVSSGGLANFAPFFPQTTGTVTFGANSVTQVVPELDNPETVVGTKLALESQVNARGRAIHFAEDATLLAPGADVTLSAGNWKLTGLEIKAPIHNFIYTSGQIYLDSGANINVAGSTAIPVPVAQNTLSVELRGSELADSPLQRDGVFRGLTIDVDLRNTGIMDGRYWIGTPLADAAGFVGLIQRTVGELTVEGGTVTLNAGESVVMQRGSTIDVSGGFLQYEAGMMKTTRVLIGGRLLPIEQATPDMLYDGIYTGQFTVDNPKYGISTTWTNPLLLDGAHWEESYIQGANGGSIVIAAPSMALDGTLRGETLPGPRQRGVQPLPSSLTLAFKGQNPEAPEIFGDVVPYYSPTPPNVTFGQNASQTPAAPFVVDAEGNAATLRADRKEQVFLSPDLLVESGFGALSVENTDGDIVVPTGITLNAQPGGSITLAGANIDIQGTVSAPGGSLRFSAYNISPSLAEFLLLDVNNPLTLTLAADPNRGRFVLGSGASLSTAGLMVDDRAGIDSRGTLALQTRGGTITIDSYSSKFSAGSIVDVSGGVTMGTNGRPTYGSGGAITIRTGKDLAIESVRGGRLNLESTLLGYSGTTGGALAIQASSIQIGGSSDTPATFLVQPEFFSQGGFTTFSLSGIGESLGIPNEYSPGVFIAPGTVIEPIAQNWLAIPHPGDGESFELQTVLLPKSLRTPVSLAFNALQIENPFNTLLEVRGDLAMGRGAEIKTDPRANVSFSGDTISLRGSVEAPGGSITVSGASSLPIREEGTALNAQVTVHLGPTSSLSTAGATVRTPNQFGNRTGAVLPGGSISVSGNILASNGSLLDVSGATAQLDIHPTYLGLDATLNGSPIGSQLVPGSSGVTSPLYASLGVPTRVDSDAGTITLRGGQELFTQATLRGDAGGPTALGGSLNVSSGRFYVSGEARTTADLNLMVTQGTGAVPTLAAGESVIGQVLRDSQGNPLEQMGHFAVNDFRAGGFDALALGGNVDFSGPVTINAARELTVARGGIIAANADVNLAAPHVALGQAFRTPLQPDQIQALRLFTQTDATGTSVFHPIPTSGSGSLTVKADLIDVGNLSMQGVSDVNLIANGGEIRGDGTLDVAGDIRLRAAQIYPATAVPFTISAADPNVVVAASTSGSRTVTLGSADLPAGFGVGSPLLGSTVAGIEGNVVTLDSGANATISRATPLVFAAGSGSVAIEASGTRQLPLSAGGQLNVYASKIQQNGTLRAPIGQINIGWDGSGEAPLGELTGTSVAVTQMLALGAGSVTSVSSMDPLSGEAMLIPYGYNPNGTSWIDPTGQDITAGGVPEKTINFRSSSLAMHHGALVDLQGGGDLFAYQFVRGIGGTTDIFGTASTSWNVDVNYAAGTLVSFGGATWSARTPSQGQTPEVGVYWSRVPQRFAVIPGYQSNFAPFAPFNNGSDATTNLASGNSGFSTSGLSVGDRVYLGESEGLAAGTYTLLPARYALMPGAFLVTPQTAAPVSFQMPDQSNLVAGYRFNDLNDGRSVPTLSTRFEVAPGAVAGQRAEYQLFSANGFLQTGAVSQDLPAPRLPMDGGHVIFGGTEAMVLNGSVAAQAAFGARAGLADISTSADLVIGGRGTTGSAEQVVLNASRLSSWGAESILIGGSRQVGPDGTAISVRTDNVTVSNAGAPLSAPEVIIVANQNLTMASDARVQSHGIVTSPTQTLLLGDAEVAGSGDGLLLRVHSDPRAQIVRSGVSDSELPSMMIESGARISGGSINVDSTAATTLDADAKLTGQAINLASGRISIAFENSSDLGANPGLVLSDKALANAQASGTLSLLGYSSIDFYGTGEFSANGRLALHAAAIRGFNTSGGTVGVTADHISLDNAPGRAATGTNVPLDGNLTFTADTITLGANRLTIGNFAEVALNASEGIRVRDTGSFATPGALEITTPVIAAGAAANQSIEAAGALTMQTPLDATETKFASGLGGTLALTGASVVANTNILLPSGSLTLRAMNGDVTIGNRAETRLDVGGTAKQFYDLVRYTGGGQITLMADAGSVMLSEGGTLAVDARPEGGDAGAISIKAAQGTFTLAGEIMGGSGSDGRDASFAIDVATVPGGALGELNATLNAGGFTETRALRIRTGDVTVDGLATARHFDLSTDAGSITVTGTINASGMTGGTIDLRAFESVVLDSSAVLTVAANRFSNAGKGGAVSLEAGSQVGGVISSTALLDIRAGSTIDLRVAEHTPTSEQLGRFTGTLHLRAPQNASGSDLQLAAIDGQVLGASSIVAEGYKLYQPAGGTITSSVQADVRANGETLVGLDGTPAAGYDAMHDRLLANNASLDPVFAIVPGAELISLAGDLTLGSEFSAPSNDWNLATFRFGPKSAAGVLTLRAADNLVFYNALNDGFTSSSFTAPLAAYNPLLPANTQSWSYRLTAGADLTAADFARVQPLDAVSSGSLLLGKNAGLLQGNNPGPDATTTSIINPSPSLSYFQTIRTGSGDITISTARDVQLLNQFATIYTAGTRVPDPTTLYTTGDFVPPVVTATRPPPQGDLGATQQNYPVQYSMAGGNVNINAGADIIHLTRNNSGELIADSTRQLPNNWLYRRGYVDPLTGQFGAVGIGAGFGAVNNPNASTTWWIDFSNFFEGVGALGGGDLTMIAGHDIANVDAAIPTNARVPKGRPDASKLIELGGGDIVVSAGRDISGGVYYVERGHGDWPLATRSTPTGRARLRSGSSRLSPKFSRPRPGCRPRFSWAKHLRRGRQWRRAPRAGGQYLPAAARACKTSSGTEPISRPMHRTRR